MPFVYSFAPKRAVVTIANGASVSSPWNVPGSCNSMLIVIPVAFDATSFWRLQTLVPDGLGADGKTETWVETYMSNSAAAPDAMSQFGDGVAQFAVLSGAFVFPYNQFGSGPLRIKTAVNQTAVRTIYVQFDIS